jgi:hypothetical protein
VIAETSPKPGAKPQSTVTKDGEFVRWGDLFGTGDCFALAELAHREGEEIDDGVAFAEWKDGAWALRQLWKIPTIWRPKGWKESDGDYLPATPATEPFTLEDFSGDGVPEIVIAGGVWKYFQENYLLRFLPKTKELKLVAYAMAKPKKVEDYVRLDFDSGRRSIWSESLFCQWKGDKLVPGASWHEESPYNNIDPPFSEAVVTRADGSEEVMRVSEMDLQPEYGFSPQPQQPDWESTYLLTTARQPFATLTVRRRPRLVQPLFDDIWGMQQAWLFEKTTGLPRRLYPGRVDEKPTGKFEDFATVSVEGDAEAAKIFTIEP